MAFITWAHVVDHAAELATVDVDAQNDILAWVNNHLNVDLFGGEDAYKTKLARIYLAAHMGTGTRRGGAVGAITSSSAGGLSRSFQVPSTTDTDLSSTSYGAAYAMLLKTTVARVGFVI